jgi:signal peptide peptidase-like protein 2B
MWRNVFLLALAFTISYFSGSSTADDVSGTISTAVIIVENSNAIMYGTSSSDEAWGSDLPREKNSQGRKYFELVYNTTSLSDPFGCTSVKQLKKNNTESDLAVPDEPFVLLVDRGVCTFAQKAFIAQEIGASALFVTDTLQQYFNRTQASDVMEEELAINYDCENGEAMTDKVANVSSPEWVKNVNVPTCTDNSMCASKQCIPTSASGSTDSTVKVCCVWDIPDFMGFGTSEDVKSRDDIKIPVLRIKMADGYQLKEQITKESVKVSFYERKTPVMDPAQVVLWLMGCLTVMIAAYKGSEVERRKALARLHHDHTPPSSDQATTAGHQQRRIDEEEENQVFMDLTIYHAFGFVIIGSGVLLLLYYTNIVLGIIVLFALGAIQTSFLVFWSPFFNCFDCLYVVKPLKNCQFHSCKWIQELKLNEFTIGDLISSLVSIGIVLWWIFERHANYSWILQDFLGISVCIVFLQTIRLPNLKIATFLLILVFLYDIFMVFITPFFFKESIMIKAAKGGHQATPTAAMESFCLRYPMDTKNHCLREEIPILLRVPKIIDWREGQAMLGLGDIVLPGLLVVFCARYDYATTKARTRNESDAASFSSSTNSNPDRKYRFGLFAIVSIGYAVGLFGANLAVILMKRGQPALLYLVPCTLGVVAFVAWRRAILGKLWRGPPELQGNIPIRASHEEHQNVDDIHDERHHYHTSSMDQVETGLPTSVQTAYAQNSNTPKTL